MAVVHILRPANPQYQRRESLCGTTITATDGMLNAITFEDTDSSGKVRHGRLADAGQLCGNCQQVRRQRKEITEGGST